MDIAWILIVVAGILEPVWVYTLERSDNFRDRMWASLTVLVVIADLYLLSVAMETLGAGMSYAVWTGIGAVTTFLLGVAIFRYIRQGRLRLLGLYLIIIGASFMLIEFFEHITFGTRMFDWSLYCVIAFGAMGLFLFVATLIPPLHAHLRRTFFF